MGRSVVVAVMVVWCGIAARHAEEPHLHYFPPWHIGRCDSLYFPLISIGWLKMCKFRRFRLGYTTRPLLDSRPSDTVIKSLQEFAMTARRTMLIFFGAALLVGGATFGFLHLNAPTRTNTDAGMFDGTVPQLDIRVFLWWRAHCISYQWSS